MDTDFKKAELEVNERIAILPFEIKRMFTDGLIDNYLSEVKQSCGFNDEEMILIGNDITLVLIGFLTVGELGSVIKESLPTEKHRHIPLLTTKFENELYLLLEEAFSIEAIKKVDQKNITPKENGEPNHPPTAMRTMESDIGKIHGYGAAASQGVGVATKAEPVVHSTSQADLQKRTATVPDYSTRGEMKME